MKTEGKIVKCENCGKWHLVDEQCECQKQQNDTPKQSEQAKQPIGHTEQFEDSNQNNKFTISENEPKCITCGKTTNGYLFCKDCYSKYKNKELLLKIKNCTEIELLDDYYEGVFTCEDGHIVKSKSERTIDDYLFEHKIPHAYERAFSIDEDPKHDLHPDFCLPNFNGKGIDVYIEHWGFNDNNIQYTKTKKYKLPIYKNCNITLICTNEKDMKDPKTALERKLKFYKEGIINFDE